MRSPGERLRRSAIGFGAKLRCDSGCLPNDIDLNSYALRICPSHKLKIFPDSLKPLMKSFALSHQTETKDRCAQTAGKLNYNTYGMPKYSSRLKSPWASRRRLYRLLTHPPVWVAAASRLQESKTSTLVLVAEDDLSFPDTRCAQELLSLSICEPAQNLPTFGIGCKGVLI